MKEERLYEVIAEHLRELNKGLVELCKSCQASELRMKEMDNQQIKYLYCRSID